SGGPITQDNTSVEYFGTVFTIAESPKQRGVIWAGSDDGMIHVTRDDGHSWQDVTPKDLPKYATVSMIEASPFDPGTAYAAVDNHRQDDVRPYGFKTTDYGQTWTSIVDGLPENAFLHAIREDRSVSGLLYAGTEIGAWVSFNGGR